MQKGDIFDEIQSLTLIIFLIDFFFSFVCLSVTSNTCPRQTAVEQRHLSRRVALRNMTLYSWRSIKTHAGDTNACNYT